MKRDDFLNLVWKKYPSVSAVSGDCFFGRIFVKSANKILLKNQSAEFEIQIAQLREGENSEFGKSIPIDCLVEGDVVAYDRLKYEIYLLSPCLHASAKLFSSTAREWAQFLSLVSQFFIDRGFLELHTPFLVQSPGVDHHIDFFSVRGSKTGISSFLPTSPEISLKKFLCQGYDQIFEIKKCFRDDLIGSHHRREFTMVEWYRAYRDLNAIADDVLALVQVLSGKPIAVERTTTHTCFAKYVGFTLTPQTTREELLSLAQDLRIDTHLTDDWNDVFFRIYMEKIEPQLGLHGLCILSDFPSQQSSLAKISAEGWSQRFEVYWQGVELANAYFEVNDPEENLKRFRHELELRKQGGGSLPGWDEEFFQEMLSGMPPTSGIALGLDRLFMLLNNKRELL